MSIVDSVSMNPGANRDLNPEFYDDRLSHSGKELSLWRKRADCDGMTHPEILASMVEEAAAQGHEPCDLNWAGLPNIYLRASYARYADESEKWIEDGFAMLVSKIGA